MLGCSVLGAKGVCQNNRRTEKRISRRAGLLIIELVRQPTQLSPNHVDHRRVHPAHRDRVPSVYALLQRLHEFVLPRCVFDSALLFGVGKSRPLLELFSISKIKTCEFVGFAGGCTWFFDVFYLSCSKKQKNENFVDIQILFINTSLKHMNLCDHHIFQV